MANGTGWCSTELALANLGDGRLNRRLLKVADDLLNSPTSSIGEASSAWKEAKAAYRLFDNEKFSDVHIKELHQRNTINRMMQSDDNVFFAIQDTTTLNYTHHPEKQGLGKVSKSKGFDKPITGCFLHNTLLMTENGLPLGLIDQKIYKHENEKTIRNKNRPITEKESYRWLESLIKTRELCRDKKVITICDRESDIYEFFVEANQIGAQVLVRASSDRIVFGEKHTEHDTLWSYMQKQEKATSITISIPAQRKCPGRDAILDVKFAKVTINPPQRSPQAQINKLSKIELYAIWFYEDTDHKDKLEWMLLTNIEIGSVNEAVRVGQWYKLRWQVECYHRVLKSGCQVENCRLETYERLKRYLALKSIIAYRLFYLTLLGRIDPNHNCEVVFAQHEWKALYCYAYKTPETPKKPPTAQEAIKMLAKLGGFLGRKNDGEPGMIPIWRGWNKLMELAELWLVLKGKTYG